MPHLLSRSPFGEAFIDQHEVPTPFCKYSDLPNHEHQRHLCVGAMCAICGFHIAGYYSITRWRYDAVVVGDLSREYECVQANRVYRSDCHEPAVFSAMFSGRCTVSKGSGFVLAGTSRYCFVYAADTDAYNGGPDGENTLYIPMHEPLLGESSRSRPLRAVLSLLVFRWSRRVWVIQEITINREVVFACSVDQVPYGYFRDSAFVVWKYFDTSQAMGGACGDRGT